MTAWTIWKSFVEGQDRQMDWKILFRRPPPGAAWYCGRFVFFASLGYMVTWALLEFVF